MPHLLQYEPTAMYYARAKVCGKLVRRRLKTDAYSKALLRLSDFLKQQRSAPPRSVNAPITFADARLRFEQALKARHDMKPRAKVYRQGCVKALLKTQPGGAGPKGS